MGGRAAASRRAAAGGRGGRRAGLTLLLALAGSGLGGCGMVEPYVFRADEFNRDSPTFNKPAVAGQPVSICYAGWVSEPEDIQKIADTQCAQFDQRASLLSTDVARCPLLTPTEAIFVCVAPPSAPPPAPPSAPAPGAAPSTPPPGS